MSVKTKFLFLLVVIFTAKITNAQKTEAVKQPPLKEISLENLWQSYNFYFSASIDDYNSMNDGIHYTINEEGSINQYNYEKNKLVKTFVSAEELRQAGLKNVKSISHYSFSADESIILLETNTESIYRHSYFCLAYVYDIAKKKLYVINNEKKLKLPELSPDGKKVSYIVDNNLFIFDLETKKEIQISKDGEYNKIINGAPDWVYEEEFSFSKAYFWSSDSKKIAWIRFDESNVKEWTIIKYGNLYPEEYRYKYPKAGEDNSKVSVLIYNLNDDKTNRVDIGTEEDIYIPRIIWTKNPDQLCILRLNRLQNKLDYLIYNCQNSTTDLLFTDENNYYVDITDDYFFISNPLDKRSKNKIESTVNNYFVYLSEKAGFNQIYFYNFSTKQHKALSPATYDVIKIYGVDEQNQTIYYQAAATSAINKEVYSINFSGKIDLISEKSGTSDLSFSKTFKYAVLGWSDANTPPSTIIINSKGKKIETIDY